MITVTADKLIATLVEVADERPDYIYTNPHSTEDGEPLCRYVHTDDEGKAEPGCIVGTVLHRLGVPLDQLAQHEGMSASVVRARTIEVTGEAQWVAEAALWRAQAAQDGNDEDPRKPWGEAVAYARMLMANAA